MICKLFIGKTKDKFKNHSKDGIIGIYRAGALFVTQNEI
jgi:hypothetical protein